MDPISNEAVGFQQTQTTRVKDSGPAQNANPPPPPKEAAPRAEPSVVDAPSPHFFRGHNLNTVA
jgi:hypothetical protein